MAVPKKLAIFQDLLSIDVLIEETGLNSQYFNITDLPEEIASGKSAFLIRGSGRLKENVKIKMEILDNQDNPVYLEPVFRLADSGGSRVAIEVYNETSEGTATLVVLGEIDPANVNFEIPDSYVGSYNIRYTRTFSINQSIRNTRPIRFHARPRLQVFEVIKGQVTANPYFTGSASSSEGKCT